MKLKSPLLFPFAAAIFMALSMGAHAANKYMSAGSGGAVWDSSTQNWGTSVSGPYNTTMWAAYDYAHFVGTGGTVTLNSTQYVNHVYFDSDGYTVSGTGMINLGNPGAQSINVGSGFTATVNTTIGVVNNYGAYFNNNSTYAGTLIVNGQIANGGGGVTIRGGTVVFNAANPYTGGTSVTAGTLRLTGTNASGSYAISSGAVVERLVTSGTADWGGSTTISGAGTLRKTGAGTLQWGGTAGTFSMSSGGVLDVQGGAINGGSNANENYTANLGNLNVASGALFNGYEANCIFGALTGSGNIKTGYNGAGYSTFKFGAGDASGTFAGDLSHNNNVWGGNYTKIGSGTQTFTGRIQSIGLGGLGLTISAGTVQIAGTCLMAGGNLTDNIINNATFRHSASVNQTLAGIMSGSGNLLKDGTGTLKLTGVNSYGGGTTINGGTLELGHATNTLADTGAVSVNGSSARLSIAGNSDTVGVVSLKGGGFIVGTTGILSGSSFALESGTISAKLGGSGGITKTTAALVTLSVANSFTGGTVISLGTLVGTSSSALGSNSGLTLSGGTFTYQAAVAGALDLGSGVISLAADSRIGAAVGGSLGQSAITSSAAASTVAGTVNVDVYGIVGTSVTGGTHDLIKAASGLNAATYTLGKIYNATNFTVGALSQSDTAVSLAVTSSTALTTEYWKGGLVGAAGVWAASNGQNASNWASDTNGTATSLTPSAAATIQFSATSASNQGAMTLGANMTVLGIVVSDSNNLVLADDGNALTIGSGGITMNASAGALTLGSTLILGGNQTWNHAGANTLAVSGGLSGVSNLTKTGTGTLALSGSSNVTGSLTINGGMIDLTGGSYGISGVTVVGGGSAAGTLRVSGGSLVSSSTAFKIGAGSAGSLTLSSGSIFLTDTSGSSYVSLGDTSNGSFTQTGGVFSHSGSGGIYIGNQTGSGTLNVSGVSEFSTSGAIYFGVRSASTISIADTALVWVGSTLNLGHVGGSTCSGNVLNLNGGTLRLGSGISHYRPASSFTINLNGGTLQSSGAFTWAASGTPANVVATIGAAGVTMDTSLLDAGNSSVYGMSISQVLGGTGALTKTGAGTLTLSGANTYSGGTRIKNGSVVISGGDDRLLTTGSVTLGDSSTNAKLVLGDTSTARNQTLAGLSTTGLGGSVVGAHATNNSLLTLNIASGNNTYGGTLGGTGSNENKLALTKTGNGTLTLSAANSYLGATTVNGGTLAVNNSTGSGTGTGTVIVQTNGILGGNGSIGGATTIATTGVLAPGNNAVATLTFTANVTLDAGSTYAVDVTSASASDKINLGANTLTANGTITITAVGHTFAAGDSYDVADAATISGTPTISPTTPGTSLAWDTSTFTTDGVIKVISSAPVDPYDGWAGAGGYNLTGQAAAKDADPDGDGANNLLEFAAGGDPTLAASGPRCYALVHSIGTDNALTYTIAVRKDATPGFAADGAAQSAIKDHVLYTVEGTNDLSTWNFVPVTEVTGADATAVQSALGTQLTSPVLDTVNYEWHTFRSDEGTAADPSDFIRLRVTEVP